VAHATTDIGTSNYEVSLVVPQGRGGLGAVVKTWSSAARNPVRGARCLPSDYSAYVCGAQGLAAALGAGVHLEWHGKDRSVTRRVRVILTWPSGRDWRTSLSAYPLR
jgi:hypothetical protein